MVVEVILLSNTINSEIFAKISFSRIALKDIFATLIFATGARFTYISKRHSDLTISQGFDFHETSHNFAKIKHSRKCPN